MTITPAQLRRYRLARHHLLAPADSPVAAAGAILGAQAQVAVAGALQLAVRCGGTVEAVEQALWRTRSLVKVWTVRGTVHYLPAELWSCFAAALRDDGERQLAAWMRRAEVDPARVEAVIAALVDSLADGPLERGALADAVVARLDESWRWLIEHSWGGLVRVAVRRGQVCFGPPNGQRVTFVLAEQWLGPFTLPDESTARRELLRRYLRAYGPATARDFACWTGGQAAAAKAAFAALADELLEVTVDGQRLSLLAADAGELQRAEEALPVRLLPHFDPLLLGHRERDWIIDPAQLRQVSRAAGWIAPVLLVDGRVAATWGYERRADRLSVTLEPLGDLPRPAVRAAEAEAERLAAAMGLAAEVGVDGA